MELIYSIVLKELSYTDLKSKSKYITMAYYHASGLNRKFASFFVFTKCFFSWISIPKKYWVPWMKQHFDLCIIKAHSIHPIFTLFPAQDISQTFWIKQPC